MTFPPIVLAIIVAILIAAEILVVAFFLHRVASKSDAEREFESQLATLTESELESDKKDGVYVNPKSWSGFWYRKFIETGRTPIKSEQPGQFAIIIALVAFGVGFLLWPRSASGGLVMAVGSITVMFFFLKFEIKRRIRTLESQLSLLIDSLMASIGAHKTPQVAMIEAAGEVPSPLGDELKALKTDLELNVPMSTALRSFSLRIPSREIKFLVSAIEIAIESGTDLQPQLEIIRETISKRAILQQKLASAVASAQPALWLSGVIIPGGLVFSYYTNDTNRDFWFSLAGMGALAVVATLFAAGMFITKKMVDGVEKV